ncbi:3-oxoacyl-[acyl-carrier-protein] reductase [Fibrobacter succinogenes subsp. succinogenes S85]|jgi:3-oxoacyl-[acyl-carrier protein] reductase|uniref:3-oxoacyl-[acyl-carrier-protein] reductase n=2 Tax=Fibrobacter succinogenes TaxID=833 RepID=C9RJ86_FIBSS|nr:MULTISPECIES: 3-oxoacyl-[acyl-carrier-protein] reductase [Fibrobacter]ACX75603.1 3-oxoacyl-(acyl-carrier-protein) reductase [Fibrobacter succinogenes subsp. succinogenes S85]ADL25272.1 3-oxoacyl-[acyl-carrier-protein] reductase [Fibrobacter succinogenes subsp. succinogenes S85]OWV20647.1 beta-ketoacyl-ACP reductase [Fibrobacter sp. UWB2]PWJ34008.1 3-oxoacyl-[acyl-carrier-protein] reductase [Fibrobacter succinogenes subsp. elongatus]SHK88609.1 3-oxoacyl-[acyl-carrier-protein] reductase [Fibr
MPTKSIVTGASRGIGLAIARELAARGSDVVLISRGGCPEQAEAIAKEFGVKTFTFACDVSNSDSVKDAFKQAIDALGGVDCLVNNAGITRDGLVLRMKDEDFDNVIATDLRSTFLCTRAVLRTMMGARKGSIVNIASLNGIRTQAGQANYAAAKAGVIGMTKSNSMEFGSRGITVNAVAPGFIDTDMTAAMSEETRAKYAAQIPLGRLGQPEDVAKAVAFLASDDAKYITGQVIGVDGGLNA